MEESKIIKIVERLHPDGSLMMRPKIKIYLNPHIHIWILETKFSELDNKIKGHIIESYWLTWVNSLSRNFKKYYYLKDKNNLEVYFASLKPDHTFKTIHEFKYSMSVSLNSLFNTIVSDKKIVWCLQDKEKDGVKYISILNSTDENGKKF